MSDSTKQGGPAGRMTPAEQHQPGRLRRLVRVTRDLVRRAWARAVPTVAKLAFPIMGILCVIAFLACKPYPQDGIGGAWSITLCVFLVLSGFPSWLYLRFLSVKVTPLYYEYVDTLYRMGVDDPEHLPEPLATSRYHPVWAQRTAADPHPDPRPPSLGPDATAFSAASADPQGSIYERKFVSFFGRHEEGARFTGLDSLLPVIVVWMAFAVGWLAILVNLAFVADEVTLEDALRFGFMGAYVFSLQLTVRAYFQNDLRSGTYVGILERLIVVLILVTVINVVWSDLFSGQPAAAAAQAVVLFVVGSFPLVGQQWITQQSSKWLMNRVPSLKSRHPLSEIDGMNVWYEARLLEEGIEDVQNLATANLVDVVLHSRAPVGRLIDWMDQALLRQHLPPDDPQEHGCGHDDDRLLKATLEGLGVRTATDLLELYSPLSRASVRELNHSIHGLGPAGGGGRPFHDRMLDVIPDPAKRETIGIRMQAILRCLGTEPNLRLILNWQTAFGPDVTSTGAGGDQARPGTATITHPGEHHRHVAVQWRR